MSAIPKFEPQAEQIELEQLKAHKQRLALEVVGGNEAARAELTKVNIAIATAEQDLELQVLAEIERKRRAEEAEKARLAKERQAGLEKLNNLRTEQNKRLANLEKEIKKLRGVISEAVQGGREIYGLADSLQVRERWRIKEDIINYLQSELGPTLGPGLGYVSPSHRHSLVSRVPNPKRQLLTCSECGRRYTDNLEHICAEKRKAIEPQQLLDDSPVVVTKGKNNGRFTDEQILGMELIPESL